MTIKFIFNIFLLCFSGIYLNAISYTGIIEPIKKVNLSLAINGIVSNIKIKEGAEVQKGALILTLNNTIQKLEVQRRKVLLDDTSRLFYLEKELKVVKSIFDASQELYTVTGSISKNELDNYEVKYYKLLGELEALKGNKKREQVEYELEYGKLKQYTLTSPFRGIITKISLDIGEWAKLGESIVELVDSSTCFVETNIPEAKVHSIKLGQTSNIKINRLNKVIEKKGIVTYISPIADSSSGLVLIKIEFENKDLNIIPGVIATMDINSI